MAKVKSFIAVFIVMMLVLTSIPLTFGVAAAGESDLAITAAGTLASTIYDGDKTFLYASLRNISGETVPKGAKVTFYVDGKLIQNVACTSEIAAGGRATVQTTVNVRLPFGTHKITAIANQDREIPESDMSNNRAKKRVLVGTDINPNPSDDEIIVINQVYGGGGKGATPFDHSFIELYNKGDDAVDLGAKGYSLQYISNRVGAGTDGNPVTLALTGKIPAHTSYLVRGKAETTEVSVYKLDKFDQDWDQVIDNKQYSVSLICNKAVIDAVTAVDAETTEEVGAECYPVVGISKQTSVRRIGFADTNDNSKDFEVVTFKGASTELINEKRPRSTFDGKWEYIPKDEPVRDDIAPNPTEVVTPKSITLDAAQATLLNGAVKATANDGYTGNGYVEQLTSDGRGVEFTYNASEAGNYDIVIRYANGSGAQKTGTVTVNNTDSRQINLSDQKYWNSWMKTSVTMNLKAGENKIRVWKSAGTNGNFNVDSIEIYRSYSKRITYFAFLKSVNPELPADIICDIDNSGLISAKIPSDLDISYLIPTFNTSYQLKVNGVVQQSGVTPQNFSNGHYYVTDEGGTQHKYVVKLIKLKDKKLPNVFVRFDKTAVDQGLINSVVGGSDKNIKADCIFTVKLGEQSEIVNARGTEFTELEEQAATIKLRGNSTLHQPKKSWNLKLTSKSKVLDMPSDKGWILLASYDDKSMMRQYLGYELGLTLNNTGFTTQTRFVNLFMNGKYNGVYLLMEKIKIGKNRLNIQSFEDIYAADPNNINFSGGYIMELDSRQANYNGDEPANVVFQGGNWWFAFKDPDDGFLVGDLSTGAKNYMSNFFNRFRDSLNNVSSGEYKKYIDIDSFVDWYLVMEIMKNLDAAGNTSIYCYKVADTVVNGVTTEQGKLYMGPLWDFDISSGNMNYSDSCMRTDGWHIRNSFWYGNLFNDPTFVQAVKERYTQWRKSGFNPLTLIRNTEANVNVAMEDNFDRWDMLSMYFWPEPQVRHSYAAYVDHLYKWIDARLSWLDTQYLIR